MPADLNEQYDKIYRYCYFKVKDAVLAEDLTQETFLRYFAQNSYKDCGKKMAYLYTIARNLCIDSFRRKQVLPLEEELAEENPMKQVEAALVIQQALSVLPPDEQELLLLRYANELSVKDIAGFTAQSRYSVYRKIKQALAKLKNMLKEEDFA